jgi:hypothetical protein
MTHEPHRDASINPEGEAPPVSVTLILDETGSMQACKGAAIAGFNEYLKTLRQMPMPVRFTLTLFNSGKMDVRHHQVPVAQVHELTEQTYQPAETTPLYNAIGHTLTAAGHQALPESNKLCVILTDGVESASREDTREGIVRLLKDCEAKGWTFVYLGADHDALAAGQDIGLSGDNTVQFNKRETGRAFDALANATTAYLSRQPNQPNTGVPERCGNATEGQHRS